MKGLLGHFSGAQNIVGHFPFNSITQAIFQNSAFLSNGNVDLDGVAYFNQIPVWGE